MPELPEGEVTRRGGAEAILGLRVAHVTIRNGNLRWPVPEELTQDLPGSVVKTIERRGKFILIGCESLQSRGTLMIHLGMTGTLRVVAPDSEVRPHDHVEFDLGLVVMRFNDPRRVGAILWHDQADGPLAGSRHLAKLGVEPLSEEFACQAGGEVLFRGSRGRTLPIKQLLLAGDIVVGVGNIYASESLFRARISPKTAAGSIGRARYHRLADAIRVTLSAAIDKGGSTLRDFVDSSGAPGYFQQDYFVYDRTGLPCRVCGQPIRTVRQAARSTFYCAQCQAR